MKKLQVNIQRIKRCIKKIVAKTIKIRESKVTLEADFVNKLGADSLNSPEIILQIEEKFHLEAIPEEASRKINCLKAAVNYVARRVRVAA